MSNETFFEHGEDVIPITGSRGRVIDIRDASDGTALYGVVNTNGVVTYYTSEGLRHAVRQVVENIDFTIG